MRMLVDPVEEKKSDYILVQRIGVAVPASEIRIRPRGEDPYRWSVLPQKAHLLQKNLSKLSVGTYAQIINGLGVFLEAVPRDANQSNIQDAVVQDVDDTTQCSLNDDAEVINPMVG